METIEHKTRRYDRAMVGMFKLSAAFLTVAISKKTQEKLQSFARCVAQLDAHVDVLPKDEMMEFAEKVLGYLSGEDLDASIGGESLLNSLRLLRDDIQSLPSDRKTQFLSEARKIFQIGQILSKTTDITKFIHYRAEEAGCLANLVTQLADEFAISPRFTFFCKDIVVMGNYIDSIRDASGDYKRGEASIKPSMTLYYRLAKDSLKHAVSALLIHPRKIDILFSAMHFAQPV